MNVNKPQYDTEVPIYDMNDELECAVKRTLVVGEVYLYTPEAIEDMQTTIKNQFAQLIYKRTISDYQKNLSECDEVAKEFAKKLLEQHPDIADLYDCGVFCENDLLEVAYDWIRQDNSTFLYHDDYLDSWPYIIETYIGKASGFCVA